MSIRTEKVASVIKRIVVEPISEIARQHSAGMVTVSSVKVSSDLQYAKIYLTTLNGKITPMEFIAILEKNKYKVKAEIARLAKLRYVPEIKMFIDDTLDQMDHIQKLLDDVRSTSNPSSEEE
ncbi:MAG: 30S ribosome-binding factor RbfA [Candidatus Kapabacteria bacterium]|nr:30S ribosome-binding factor RbfA [Candidatus Kapabacteria bacterium]